MDLEKSINYKKEELHDSDESSRPLCGRDWLLELCKLDIRVGGLGEEGL